jgi:hypothetical protein
MIKHHMIEKFKEFWGVNKNPTMFYIIYGCRFKNSV